MIHNYGVKFSIMVREQVKCSSAPSRGASKGSAHSSVPGKIHPNLLQRRTHGA